MRRRRTRRFKPRWTALRSPTGTATLYIGGKSVGIANVEQTQFALFSADETAGVGVDLETPVSEDYTRASSRFIGKIDKVTISTKK